MNKTNEYQQLQIIDYQLRQFQSIIETVDAQLIEASASRDALVELKKLQGNEDVLFPITNGIFAKGKITDSKNLRLNVGSNIVVEKSTDEAITMMEKQVEDLEDYKGQLTQQMTQLVNKAEELQQKLSD